MANTETTRPSRRAAMTALASVAAIGTTVAAAGIAADPIFAAIERHRTAQGRLDELWTKLDELEPDPEAPPQVMLGTTRTVRLTFDDGETHVIGGRPFYATSIADIDRQILADLDKPGADVDAFVCKRALLHEEFATQTNEGRRREAIRAKAAPELQAMRDEAAEAEKAESDALQSLISTRATTAAGVIALLEYITNAFDDYDETQVCEFIEAAAASLRLIAA